uniref:Arylsulfatase B-like n=1 Tax=Saccoglossus kowalevskii TaxID=10224 RepID=A0ABM0GNJ1_SACKO|nr:PREDICTED: arylsulfatase B-like [Saccoglossus kowalevskii]
MGILLIVHVTEMYIHPLIATINMCFLPTVQRNQNQGIFGHFLTRLILLTSYLTVIQATQRPHIVFILADDLGYFDVGYRNGSIVKTPNIDKLAAEGVKLERHYAQPSCMPSRSCLMMGRYQIHTGFNYKCTDGSGSQLCMHPDTITIPMKLKENGYATHMVGKWHLGNIRWECLPNAKGFDTFFGYHGASEDYYTHFSPAGRECRDLWRNRDDVAQEYYGQYSTHIFTNEALNIIENHDVSKPMFLYLPYQAVHGPLQVPEKYYNMYERPLDDIRRKYAAMATCMDEGIGNVTNALKQRGMWDNTVFIFVSDNGAQFPTGGRNWPLRGGKGSVFEGGIRVVSFVTSPLIERPQRSSNEMIHLTDWLPTLTHLAGGTVDDVELDGVNMWDTISKGSATPRKELLVQISPPHGVRDIGHEPWYKNGMFDVTTNSAIIVGNWKLVTNEGYYGGHVVPPELESQIGAERIPPPESKRGRLVWLFHIGEDTKEKHEMSNERPDIVFRLLERLRGYQSHAVFCRHSYASLGCTQRGNRWGPPLGM